MSSMFFSVLSFICNVVAVLIVLTALAVVAFIYGSNELVEYLNQNYVMIPKN